MYEIEHFLDIGVTTCFLILERSHRFVYLSYQDIIKFKVLFILNLIITQKFYVLHFQSNTTIFHLVQWEIQQLHVSAL